MSTITKERLEPVIERLEHYATNVKWTNVQAAQDMLTAADAMRRLLASLEAEPVGYMNRFTGRVFTLEEQPGADTDVQVYVPVYTAPPAPVSVPEWTNEQCLEFLSIAFRHVEIKGDLELDDIRLGVKMANGSRADMLQGADNELQRKAAIQDSLCEKYNVESLTDFVDWQRNNIAELEAAPPAPVGPNETAVMPDYPGYAMTQRECYQAGKKAGLDEVGNSPVIPDGWVMVPCEPTLEMIKAGANAASSGMLIPGMYRAMLAAAPQQEAE